MTPLLHANVLGSSSNIYWQTFIPWPWVSGFQLLLGADVTGLAGGQLSFTLKLSRTLCYNNDTGGPPPTNYIWWVVLIILMNLIVGLSKKGLWQVTNTQPSSTYDSRPSLMRGTRLRLGYSLFVVIKELSFTLLAHIEIGHSAIVLCFSSETWVVWRLLGIRKYQLL